MNLLFHSQGLECDLIFRNSDWFSHPYTNRCNNPPSHGKSQRHDSYRRNQGNDTQTPLLESGNLWTMVNSQNRPNDCSSLPNVSGFQLVLHMASVLSFPNHSFDSIGVYLRFAEFNEYNDALFNIRARSLNNLVYWLSQIVGSITIGMLLDQRSISRRIRAFSGWTVLLAMVFIVHIWAFFYQKYVQSDSTQWVFSDSHT